MDLIFSLFDIASAQEVPFGILQYVLYNTLFMDLLTLFMFHSSLLTAKVVNLVVACDDFLSCVMEPLIVCIFHRVITEKSP